MLPRLPCSKHSTHSSIKLCTNCVWGPAILEPTMDEMRRKRLAEGNRRGGSDRVFACLGLILRTVLVRCEVSIMKLMEPDWGKVSVMCWSTWNKQNTSRFLSLRTYVLKGHKVDSCWLISLCGAKETVLTQNSVEGFPHVDRVKLGCREGAAHRSVSCQTTHDVRNETRGFLPFANSRVEVAIHVQPWRKVTKIFWHNLLWLKLPFLLKGAHTITHAWKQKVNSLLQHLNFTIISKLL